MQRLYGGAIAMRPVEAGPRQQRRLAVVHPRMHALAVILDLVQPLPARGASSTRRVSCGLIHPGGLATGIPMSSDGLLPVVK